MLNELRWVFIYEPLYWRANEPILGLFLMLGVPSNIEIKGTLNQMSPCNGVQLSNFDLHSIFQGFI